MTTKTDGTILKVLEHCASRLQLVFDDRSDAHYLSVLVSAYRELKCKHIFTKGKNEGKICGVINCQHHKNISSNK